MKRLTMLAVLIAGVLLGFIAVRGTVAADPAEDQVAVAQRKDRQLLEGRWRAVALEVNGEKAAEQDARKLLVVNGPEGHWTLFHEGDEVSRGTSTFDATKKPKWIDFSLQAQDGTTSRYVGIYELGEQQRRLCFAPASSGRPTEFRTLPGSMQILVVFLREATK